MGECILCILLAMIVSVVGIHVLHSDIYYDLEVFVFCCVIAASQYSLVKSCQPDVNTPVHVRTISRRTHVIFSFCQGFNRHTAISRAIYFCLFSSPALIRQSIESLFVDVDSLRNQILQSSCVSHALQSPLHSSSVFTIAVLVRSSSTMFDLLSVHLGEHRYAFLRWNGDDQHSRRTLQSQHIHDEFRSPLDHRILRITHRYLKSTISPPLSKHRHRDSL